jgi:hypothetical protein
MRNEKVGFVGEILLISIFFSHLPEYFLVIKVFYTSYIVLIINSEISFFLSEKDLSGA